MAADTLASSRPNAATLPQVIQGLVPGIKAFTNARVRLRHPGLHSSVVERAETWIPATSAGMTGEGFCARIPMDLPAIPCAVQRDAVHRRRRILPVGEHSTRGKVPYYCGASEMTGGDEVNFVPSRAAPGRAAQ